MPGVPTVTSPTEAIRAAPARFPIKPVANSAEAATVGLSTRVSGPTSGTRIALLHGFTQTGRSWGTVAAALTAAGHEVVTVDMPGHGGSGAVRADLPTSADLVTTAAGRAVYVGYSMGGRVALHAALRAPALVRGLVLIGATAGIDDEAERATRRAADEVLAADLERDGLDVFLTRWLASPLFATLPRAAAGMDERRMNCVDGLAASLRLCGTGTQDPLWERLAAIACPVAILAGSFDDKFRALGRQLAASIGPNATFTSIGHAGHAAHLERPDAVVAAISGLAERAALAG